MGAAGVMWQARAEADELLQKQFDAIAELLTDDYPIVRLTAVEGCVNTSNSPCEHSGSVHSSE
eukprot:m.596743 g.596743  ORF g.596743 m.596743 type:complete len:63 (-) comp22415_c0_seq4:1287-1475(-)